MVPLARSMAGAYLLFGVTMALFAARASPFQAMMAELVPDRQRGSLMSLSMAVGQAGLRHGKRPRRRDLRVLRASAATPSWPPAPRSAMAVLVALYLPETCGAETQRR
jgi:hypothetical protein